MRRHDMCPVGNERARQAELTCLDVCFDELLLVFCLQRDFRTSSFVVLVTLGDFRDEVAGAFKRIFECVAVLGRCFASIHLKGRRDD